VSSGDAATDEPQKLKGIEMFGRIVIFLYGATVAIVAPVLVVQLTAELELPKLLIAFLGFLASLPGCLLAFHATKN